MRSFSAKFLVIALPIVVASDVYGGSYLKGLDAYKNGDYQTALEEWKERADNGHPASQWGMGKLYLEGNGVRKDSVQAQSYLTLAAEQDQVFAQKELAWQFYIGENGIIQNYKKAVYWTLRLVENPRLQSSNPLFPYKTGAMLRLARLLYRGEGVQADPVLTHMWLILAAGLGESSAVSQRDRNEPTLSSAQVNQAQELAQECMARKFIGCMEYPRTN